MSVPLARKFSLLTRRAACLKPSCKRGSSGPLLRPFLIVDPHRSDVARLFNHQLGSQVTTLLFWWIISSLLSPRAPCGWCCFSHLFGVVLCLRLLWVVLLSFPLFGWCRRSAPFLGGVWSILTCGRHDSHVARHVIHQWASHGTSVPVGAA